MMMKRIPLLLSAGTLVLLASCSHDRSMEGRYDPNNPGYEYAPEGDMYHAIPYEPMSQYEGNVTFKNFENGYNPINPDSMNMRMPVKGTIARGKTSYYFPYKNTPEDYERAAGLQNPAGTDAKTLAEGKRLFETYCWQCHGSESSPKGSLVEAGKFPPPTWDFGRKALLTTLPEGRMFFSITYGRNLMGPHGSIVQPDQRWKIIRYLKSAAGGAAAPAPVTSSDTAKANTATTATTTQNANH
jgi:mono/diheme cytochrome c family protein